MASTPGRRGGAGLNTRSLHVVLRREVIPPMNKTYSLSISGSATGITDADAADQAVNELRSKLEALGGSVTLTCTSGEEPQPEEQPAQAV